MLVAFRRILPSISCTLVLVAESCSINHRAPSPGGLYLDIGVAYLCTMAEVWRMHRQCDGTPISGQKSVLLAWRVHNNASISLLTFFEHECSENWSCDRSSLLPPPHSACLVQARWEFGPVLTRYNVSYPIIITVNFGNAGLSSAWNGQMLVNIVLTGIMRVIPTQS